MPQNYKAAKLARRDDLIAAHLHLVEPLARALLVRLPPSFDLDDLVQAGYLALLQAAERYSPADHGGAPFSAYARVVVRGAMIDSVKGPRYLAATCEPLEAAPETSQTFDLVRHIDEGRKSAKVKKVVEMLPQQHRAVVERYYVTEEPTFERVAAEMGVSRTRMRELKSEALEMIRATIQDHAA